MYVKLNKSSEIEKRRIDSFHFYRMKSIPAHVLLSAEIRSLEAHEDKASHIKNLRTNIPLTTICSELGADYDKSYRRWRDLKEGRKWAGIGHPPLINYKDAGNLHCMIRKQFLKGDCTDFSDVSTCINDSYRTKLDRMTSYTLATSI